MLSICFNKSHNNIRNRLKYLHPADFVPISYLLIVSVIFIIYSSRITLWFTFAPVNLLLSIGLVWLISKYEMDKSVSGLDEGNFRPILKLLRYWYGIAVILLSFKESYYIIQSLKPQDIDAVLIRWDYMIFGVNPTIWAYRFANKYLTEFLQIIYFYYYFMIIVYGLENYLWKKYEEFKYTILVLFTAFFSSYLLYMVFPANGPRFHLHDFYSISKDLPGIFLTEPIRSFLNTGESIPPGVANPQDYVQRDAMPSLHISIAILIAYLSWKFRSRSFYFYLPYSILMVIATIYLRYHYVVDIFAGIIIALAAIILSVIVDGKRTQAST